MGTPWRYANDPNIKDFLHKYQHVHKVTCGGIYVLYLSARMHKSTYPMLEVSAFMAMSK